MKNIAETLTALFQGISKTNHMRTLKNLIDAKQLSKKEQQAIKGGSDQLQCWVLCHADYYCNKYNCYENHPER